MTDPVPSKAPLDPLVDELRAICRLLPLEIAGRAAERIEQQAERLERLQRELDQANRNLAMAIGAAQPPGDDPIDLIMGRGDGG